ncbi:unnamed protein product, partial [Polarella glacialis]
MCHMEGVLQHVVSGGQAAVNDLTGFLSTQQLRRRFPGTDLEAVVRLQRVFRSVSGGILADTVGYGKTCCMLALIAATKHLPRPHGAQTGGLVASNATLIITPPNLFDQWQREVSKFLGTSLKLVAISSTLQLQNLKVQDVVEADIVLVPYRFFLHESYRKHCDTMSGAAAPISSHIDSADSQFGRAKSQWLRLFKKECELRNLPASTALGWESITTAITSPSWADFMRKHPSPQLQAFQSREVKRDNKNVDYQTRRVLRLEAIGRELGRRLAEDPGGALALQGPALELFCFRRICFD